jgi:aminoglycoside 2''-phosphotransferase
MPDLDAYWRDQIHRVMPDLEILEYECHQEGLVNDVVIVNNEWVLRFTKTDWGKEMMENEDRLMDFLQSELPLPVPKPVKCAEGVMVYKHLVGESFTREAWLKAAVHGQQSLADQLGEFLYKLHTINPSELDWDIPYSYAPVTRETWLDIHDRVVDKVYPLLLPHQIDWVEALFDPALSEQDFFGFKQTLVHADLAPYHILCDPERSRLTAVIDFGVAGLGDPATDFGSLLNAYGESLVVKLGSTYPGMDNLIPRARFYARAIELQWVLLGLESGENYWFTAHLGGARDIWGGTGRINP